VKIKLLSDSVINRIAAGEVVDRPVAVVRELVDNAVDAGASEINIEIEQGGKVLIRVSDNGSGMSAEDIKLSVQRHATSKISDDADLQKLQTLGFRGEALPSIASVSRLIIKSREHSASAGVKLVVDGGQAEELVPVAFASGTEVSVTNLFFNTPARKKFLKSDLSEERGVLKWLQSYALAHPKIKFRLLINSKESFVTPVAASVEERAKNLLGKKLVSARHVVGAFSVETYLSHPGVPPEKNIEFTVIVNNRLVSDRAIFRAVKDAYGSMLKHFESPTGLVKIDLPGWVVDVNVHPQKSEVRFRNSGEIFKLVYECAQQALREFRATHLVTEMSNLGGSTLPPAAVNYQNLNYSSQSSLFQSGLSLENSISYLSGNKQFSGEPDLAAMTREPASILTGFSFEALDYKCQVLGCFLVCEYQNSLVLLDLHAAHERINYNRIRREIADGKVKSQLLLIPENISLGSAAIERFADYSKIWQQFGFEIEVLDDVQICIKAVPSILGSNSVQDLMAELLSADGELALSAAYDRKLDYVAARLACHASLRSGDVIKPEEARALFKVLDQEEAGAACPHGRPVLVQFSRKKVESWFGRDS
jgi:DNA mismatch repair protein MutL